MLSREFSLLLNLLEPLQTDFRLKIRGILLYLFLAVSWGLRAAEVHKNRSSPEEAGGGFDRTFHRASPPCG